MEKNLISIIVPIYNSEKYLKKCVNSIINQTYKDLEIILVDDGSSDACPKICDEFAELDNRIVVLHKKNEGVSAARNSGLDIAKGEYIGFVDSDDYIAPDMYEMLLTRILKENSDMACCNYLQVDENCKSFPNQQLPLKDECLNAQEAMQYFILYGAYYVAPWNKLYKKNIYQTLRFPVGKRYEDLRIIHDIVFKCNRISHINKAPYYYVRRSESFTMDEFNIEKFDHGEAWIDIYHFARKNHLCSLKDYCARRLAYIFEEWWEQIELHPEYLNRFNEVKHNSYFLLWEKAAWDEYNIKGKIWSRIQFVRHGIFK